MSTRRLQTAIENPTLELKIVSANDVSHIYATDKLDLYAVVSVKDNATQKKQAAKTPIDYDGDSSPTWNHTVKFPVSEKAAREGLLTVCVKLFSYWLDGENDLYMGEVNVSVQELLASNPIPRFGNVNKMKSVTYPLKFIGETTPNAKLSLSYRFKPSPVNDMYPPPPAPVNDMYPPPSAPVDDMYLPPPAPVNNLYPQPSAPDLPPFDQPVYPNPDPARSGQPIIYPPQFRTTGQSQTNTVMRLAMELVIKSADNIKNVNVFDDMDVYASVMIREGETTIKHKAKTPIAYSGFIFPRWNHPIKFSFEEEVPRENRLTLVVKLMSHRPLLGDKLIGEVNVGIKELIGSNPPSPLTDINANGMKLVTRNVRGTYGEKGTLSFTYRFLEEQVTIPIVPHTTPQPFIMYVPVPHPSYVSAPGYMTVHPGENVGPSNGLVPTYMQPHGFQQYPQPQPQPQPQQQLPQPLPQSQFFQSQENQQYSQPQPQQQPPPQKSQPQPQPREQLFQQQYSPSQPQPTQSPQVQMQGAKPQKKQQGAGMAALGLGAAVMGRVIGGALMGEMMSDEVNIYEVGACGL